MSSFEPIPLAIGFTGHRDIAPDDEDKLRGALKERLGKLKDATSPTPLRAFTGLAEGGDMLFAEAAAELGIEIIAVMPVEIAEFVRDFEKPAQPARNPLDLKKRFDDLLGKVADNHVIPIPPGTSPERVRSYGPERDAQYAAVGAYIVRQSAILFAIWDGVMTDKPGGTGDVVRFKREGVPPQPGESDYFPAPPDGGPVLHLKATRGRSMGKDTPEWHELYPEEHRKGVFKKEFNNAVKQLQRFNQDGLWFAREYADRCATSRRYLLPADVALDTAGARAVNTYAVADALAIYFQMSARGRFVSITVLAIAMVLAFEFYGHIPPNSFTRMLIVGYVALFIVAWGIYAYEGMKRIYTRFLDYRCLAEGLRVQIFWHLAGCTESVADSYLHQVRGELRWIRDALRSISVRLHAVAPRLDLVRQHWVLDQFGFFERAAKREEGFERKATRWGNILFLGGWSVTLALAILELRFQTDQPKHDDPLFLTALLAIALVTAIAGAIRGYAIKRAYAEHAKQYGRMERVFALARKRLESVDANTPPDRLTGLLLELGREALAENADWILLHRGRLVEPPI
jgi:hypothetical protein